MTDTLVQLTGQDESQGITERCAALGFTLVSISNDGAITSRWHVPDSPLERAVVGSPMLAGALRAQVTLWNAQEMPQPVELWPGCWAMAAPMIVRRRRGGYHVALMLTARLAEAEQLHHLCDLARMDRQIAVARIANLGHAEAQDVARFAAMLNWMVVDLQQHHRQQYELCSLSQQLTETYEELSLVYSLSAHMTVRQDARSFLDESCLELQQVIGLRWMALWLGDHDPRLADLRRTMVVAGSPRCDRSILADVGRSLLEHFGTGGPRIVDDVRTLGLPHALQAAQRMLIVPIGFEGKPIAVLFGGEKISGGELSSVDSKLATSTAQNMAIFLENAMLYEDLQGMFMGTLHSLISAIDAKDTYTCGHSERVAWLSRSLARAAGLDAATVERVYLSAVVHDVGKIGVPESVLCKPGKLTAQEFTMIRAHPEIGVRILKDIHQMQDLLPGVLHHHERFDGGGYPHGLSGENIPLFGRLICLADSFDAMCSTRTYRAAMPVESAVREIERNAGTQFDPKLAYDFVRMDLRPYMQMVHEHQTRQSPLRRAMRTSG